jgi:ABC-type glutathione transport system ATPase component
MRKWSRRLPRTVTRSTTCAATSKRVAVLIDPGLASSAAARSGPDCSGGSQISSQPTTLPVISGRPSCSKNRATRSTKANSSPVILEVAEGEVFGFLGPNGAGKTTTIKLLLDLVRPTRGRAEVLGLARAPPALRSASAWGWSAVTSPPTAT